MEKYSNYYMPFEGLEHEGTIMMLPYRDDTWKNGGATAFLEFEKIINIIAKYEKVFVLKSPNVKYDISPILNNENIIILDIDYNDCWSRDTSPIFLVSKDVIGVDFRFNAWGGSYDGLYYPYDLDDQVSTKILSYLGYERIYVKDFILEGGSINTNGKGTLVTTEACLLSKGRNNLPKEEIEKVLKDKLNIKKVIWLKHGIYNDETNEHVDNICAFYNENTCLISWPEETNKIQYEYSKECLEILESNNLNVIKITAPSIIRLEKEDENSLKFNEYSKKRIDGDILAASYINFYQSSKFVIIPGFGVEEDEIALKEFKELYKDKDVYQVNTLEILKSGGNIHCITYNIPKGENNEN